MCQKSLNCIATSKNVESCLLVWPAVNYENQLYENFISKTMYTYLEQSCPWVHFVLSLIHI